MTSADIKTNPYEIVVAKDLHEGLSLSRKQAFGLLLLDLSIKGNKGLDALLTLKENHFELPIVILASREDQSMAMEAVKCGAQDYLIKGRLESNLLERMIHYAIERHRVMSEMMEKNRELEHLMALKSEFVSTVSHELRTPLTVILNSSNNMLDGAMGDLNEEQKKWVKKINGHALRLHDMINDILDLSKLQAGTTEMRRQWVDIPELIRGAMDSVSGLALEKQIELKYLEPHQSSPLWADGQHLERVFTNLLSNGIKYTPRSGCVSVEVSEFHGQIEFCVADNGPGIAPEHQEMIFERFRQIRQTESSDKATQGIGLGLAICKEIVTQHNGRIWVESQPGQGSRFLFSLPLQPAESKAKAA
ncbi:MAG: Adaptive-response sensory-kinase SasA [Elusimicrobia bacterium]|nr:Adaptive-response sensory-kinase SasA [Elusimicrobiota bacterium]